MIEKIKAHWKEILIVLFVLFSVNQCTKRCTNGQNYKKAQIEIDSLKQVNASLAADTLSKAHTIDMLNEKLNTSAAQTDAANARTEVVNANQEAANAKAQANKLRRQLQNRK